MKYEQLNHQLIALLGGKTNIKTVAHCTTRLRLTLVDVKLAQTKEIKALDGVIDVVVNDIAYQVIIGTHVTEVYNEFIAMVGLKQSSKANNVPVKGIKGVFQSIFVVVSETMSSIVELLLAAGLIAGVLSILTMSGLVSSDSPTGEIFSAISTATFYFLPILVASAAAKRFGINPYVAMVLAGTLLSSNINGVEGLTLFGLSLKPIVYANSFIPILLAVWFLSIVVHFLQKFLPRSLHYFLLSAIALSLTLPVTLLFFGPIGEWIGLGISGFFNLLQASIGNWFVVMIYAALLPFLIAIGAGNFVAPIVIHSLATQGYDPIFFAATISDLGVAGAMLGYFLRTKRQKERQLFGTVGFSAFMGITEPAIFGVFLKYRRPFIAVMLGGGAGGLLAGLMGVKRMVYAWGLTSLPTYLQGGIYNFVWMLVSVTVSFSVAAMVAYGVGIPTQREEEFSLVNASEEERNDLLATTTKGSVVTLKSVANQAFSSGALGEGIGIIPSGATAQIFSPIAGVVSEIYPTKHAYGIKTTLGEELLIHLGVDSMHTETKYFKSAVQEGMVIQAGDPIASLDVSGLKSAGMDPTIIVVVTKERSNE